MKINGRRRHVFIWKALRPLAAFWLRRKFNYSPVPANAAGPYVVISNHVTDWDPLLIALCFREQMYFVASEHIFHWGLLTRLIVWLQAPISRLKGKAAPGTARETMRRIRAGHNVCVFAEADLTWDGRTGGITPSTGKLIRLCGATLVTFKFTGGYLSAPRWGGRGVRRGKMSGAVVGIYPGQALAGMSAEQINETIYRDLYEDASARQRETPVAFKGKDTATHLETALCVCPGCGRVDTLRSEGDRFFCAECGFAARYTEQGFFEGENLPFDSVADWSDWQLTRLSEYARGAADGPIFEDEDILLSEILPGRGLRLLGGGGVALYRDRLVCAGESFALAEISGMAMHGNKTINFSSGARSFEISSKRIYCARKYLLVYNLLQNTD